MIAELINTNAEKYNLRPELIAAVIHQESRGHLDARRPETAFYARYCAGKTRETLIGHVPAEEKVPLGMELIARATSFGLMQMMGQTARERGFSADWMTDLEQPEINIPLACGYLAHLLAISAGSEEKMLLHYNGGSNGNYNTEVLSHIADGSCNYLFSR